MEKTLSMIKPEAVGRGLSGKIIAAIEESGLKVVAQKMLRLSREQAARFYAVHQNKAFFDELIENITAGPVIVQVLAGENAIELRRLYGVSIEKNAVHGSDGPETAEREIAFFFNRLEILE